VGNLLSSWFGGKSKEVLEQKTKGTVVTSIENTQFEFKENEITTQRSERDQKAKHVEWGSDIDLQS
jgi:hypothetical protein